MSDIVRVAAALRVLARNLAGDLTVLADAIENTPAPVGVPAVLAGPPAEPPKRGRGRPAAIAAPVAADPFAVAPAPAPAVTKDDVRAVLTALAGQRGQDMAVRLMKDVGGTEVLSTLQADKFVALHEAATRALAAPAPAPAEPEPVDPFESTPAEPVVQEDVPTLEAVKSACLEAGKRYSKDSVTRILIKHGGKATNPETGVEGPSVKALPVSAYAAVIKEVNALPTAK